MQVAAVSGEEKQKLLAEKQAASALPKIVVAGYQALQLIYFFTGGDDEVRAWTIRVSCACYAAAAAAVSCMTECAHDDGTCAWPENDKGPAGSRSDPLGL